MMKIEHIFHSGFLLETETTVIIFDYYKGKLPAIAPDKALFVFSSHFHYDHFNLGLYRILAEHKACYILSDDIKHKYNKKFFLTHGVTEEQYAATLFIGAGEKTDVNGLQVETLPSTDSGVAFIVTVDGKTIYHAGDLNLWTWDKEDESYNTSMTQTFQATISQIAGRHFDLAFVTLDPRQGARFADGFDYFMRQTESDRVCPMHYSDESSVVERLLELPLSEPYRHKIVLFQQENNERK